MKNRVEWAGAPYLNMYGQEIRHGEVRRVRIIARHGAWVWVQEGNKAPFTVAQLRLQPDPGAKPKGAQ